MNSKDVVWLLLVGAGSAATVVGTYLQYKGNQPKAANASWVFSDPTAGPSALFGAHYDGARKNNTGLF